MNAAMKWFLVIGIIAVTFVLPVILQSMTENKSKNLQQVEQESANVPTPSPVVVKSIPPTSVIAGSDFTYRISVETNPIQEIVAVVTEKPDWLEWDETQKILTGKVPEKPGTFTATVVVTTLAGDSVTQKMTVIITANEAAVQGASTTMTSFDPFHPEVTTTVEPTPEEIIPTTVVPTAVWQLSGDSFTGIGTTPETAQVLGESTSTNVAIRVDYLLYGAAGLLLVSIGYLLARLFSKDKNIARKTSSGVVVQSVRS